jgi:DNA uptake protein ComE-like DNA-binding protein
MKSQMLGLRNGNLWINRRPEAQKSGLLTAQKIDINNASVQEIVGALRWVGARKAQAQ